MLPKIARLFHNHKLANYAYEQYYYQMHNKSMIVGIDEVGVGSLAGPVIAAAVYIKPELLTEIHVCDSKLLNLDDRAQLSEYLHARVNVGIGMASVAEVDTYNIRQATFLAWKRSLYNLSLPFDWLLVDGNIIPSCYQDCSSAIIKGDKMCISIAAASICAKNCRDQIMQFLSLRYPKYAWYKNMGYGTLKHRQSIKKYGFSPEHRRSFTCKIS